MCHLIKLAAIFRPLSPLVRAIVSGAVITPEELGRAMTSFGQPSSARHGAT
jgi:hypothetical protein